MDDPDPLAAAPAAVQTTIEAVIFDLDGTLVDSEPNYLVSDRAFFALWDIDFTKEINDGMMGRGTMDFFRILARLFPASPLTALPFEERIARRDSYYLDFLASRNLAFPVMSELVEVLHGRGLPLAIASGSSPTVINATLAATGLASRFSVVLSSSEVSKGKPDPEVFLETARRLGVSPQRCLVFEDAVHGLTAAKRALMRCIVFPAPGSDLSLYSAADRIFPAGPAATPLAALLSALDLPPTA